MSTGGVPSYAAVHAAAISIRAPFRAVPHVESIDALSQTLVDPVDGSERSRAGGDWRAQLDRYVQCQQLLIDRGQAGFGSRSEL